jgi:transcriptional regulator with XRE-family HTH domain
MPASFGEWLKKQREAQGITQRELAQKAGLPQTTLSHIERDESDPRLSDFVALVEAVGGTIGDALGLPEHDAETAELLLWWRQASAEEKRALLIILRAMTTGRR